MAANKKESASLRGRSPAFMAAFQSALMRSFNVMVVILFSFKKYKNRLVAVFHYSNLFIGWRDCFGYLWLLVVACGCFSS